MELIQETKKNLSEISDNAVILDNNSGIYNYKYILELIKVNCILTDKELNEIDLLIDNFDPLNTDIDSILWVIDDWEDIVNEVLPDNFCIGFSENGDYLIYEYEEDWF